MDQLPPVGPIVIDGTVVEQDKETISLQLYPGAVIDVKTAHVSTLEEGTDPVSGRSFVRLTLTDDCEIKGAFTPRLMKLALSRDPTKIPFAIGGRRDHAIDPSTLFFPSVARRAQGGGGPGGGLGDDGTWGESHTRSQDWIWGWVDDDTDLNDISSFPG